MAPTLIEAARYESFAAKLIALRADTTTPVEVEGISYPWSRVSDLEAITRYLQVTQAIERIQIEGQAGGIGGRNLTRADLPALYKREAELRSTLPADFTGATTRTGIRVRYGVPT